MKVRFWRPFTIKHKDIQLDAEVSYDDSMVTFTVRIEKPGPNLLTAAHAMSEGRCFAQKLAEKLNIPEQERQGCGCGGGS